MDSPLQLLKAVEMGEKLLAIALFLGGLRISAEIAFVFSQKKQGFIKSEGQTGQGVISLLLYQ